jgi:hypothetical protein
VVREGRVLFWKKEPKNFWNFSGTSQAEAHRQIQKSLFASFSSEKEETSPR